VFIHTKAQNSTLSVDFSNRPVYQILDLLEQQTAFSFVYDASVVDLTYPFSLQVSDRSFFDILNILFEQSDVAYTVINNKIILSRKEAAAILEQQIRKVSGIVTDDKNEPIIGANVFINGTTWGTITDLNGKFVLDIPVDSTLTITYIGYHPQQFIYKGEPTLDIILLESTWSLEEVVVTALGIRKKESALTYATQSFSGDELMKGNNDNFMNLLTGRTAGVLVNRNSSGLGGSARVVIRGGRSVSGNNQPLYVIDGVPMLNSTNEQANTALGGTANAANRDGGDGISNLNQNDIESINILKGASASALYGSQAANGVILITTKSGRPGLKKIEFSSNLMFDKVAYLPSFQNTYGRSEGSTSSWGEAVNMPAYDNLGDFFRTGISINNSISISSGNEKAQTYFSYANTTANGIMDNNKFNKHNINLRETAGLFDNKLTLDGNVNLIIQNAKNRPSPGGIYMNPLSGLYTFPRGMDISLYKESYETFDPQRNMPVQNWFTSITDYDQNPYWLINRIQSTDKRNRFITSLMAKVKLTDWLTLQARGNMDYIHDKFKQKIYATTSPGIAGMNGRYIDYTYQETLIYGDIMATMNKIWGDFSFNSVIGASITDTRVNALRLDSNTASLYYPNVFTIANINMSTSAYINESNDQRRQLQSVFAMAQAGYKEGLYLDVTLRNDWSSTLSHTKSKHSGFFYPSIGASWVMNKTVVMPEWINYAKIRSSWSKVGNDIPLFVSNPVSHIGSGGALLPNDTAPFDELKPETSTSLELGTEWRLFNNRLEVDFTFYKTNTKNQLFTLPSSAGASYRYYHVNAGNIENRGIELTLGANPVQHVDYMWKTTFNFSRNKNIVKKLHDELPTFIYGDEGFSSSYSMRLVEGGSFGDIYGKAFDRDPVTGEIRYDDDGIPIVIGDGNTIKVGNSNPDFLLGWDNLFTYRNFTFQFLIDGRFGGEVLSQTQAILDQYGVSKRTGDARNDGYIGLEGHQVTNIREFFEQIGGRSGATEYYMYDATNIRLRELSISYSFPKQWLEKTNLLKGLRLSLVGRNLFYLYKDAPFDPDVVLSTDNNNQGIDIFGMPSTRSYGFNLKVTF